MNYGEVDATPTPVEAALSHNAHPEKITTPHRYPWTTSRMYDNDMDKGNERGM